MGSMIHEHAAARDEMDEAFGSIGRFRIMAELARHPGQRMTVYSIASVTRLKRTDIKANLSRLIRIGWVEAHESPLPVKYQINLTNTRAAKFAEFLRSTGYFSA
jgi:DNA-binding MarR family transcriptional regulator